MRFRGKSIRRKIVALLLVPLVSLTGMWAFATYLTGREADQLLDVGNVVRNLAYPTEGAVQALQGERRQSLLYLADRRGADALTVLRQRTRETDAAVTRLRANATDPDVREDLDGQTAEKMDAVLNGFAQLASLRSQVEHNTITREAAFEAYDALVDPNYDFLAALHALENVEMDKQARGLVQVTRAREALSREEALFSAVLASGSMSRSDLRAFSDRVAERKVLYDTGLSVLPDQERAIYDNFWGSAKARELISYEDQVIATGAAGAPHAVNAERWHAASGAVLDDLMRMGTEAADRYQERVEPVALSVLVKAGIAGVLGFLALLISVVVSLRIGRRHVRDLTRLRKDAHEVSGVRLPSVMRRLAAGEQVDVETEAPRLEFGPDEMGQVGQALNTLQRAAVEAAVKQADMRRGISEVFVNLARRSQVLLHRQLTLLDAMERRTEDTDELADLFRLDHLTTRMRRHAEGLVILSGAAPSRQWRKPIQLMDVVRAAVAEVEDYERIEVRRLPRLAVEGPAVSDLTHLIAELLENATVFSPPHTAVQVHGERVANGFSLEIHDRGLGMAADALLDANLRLAETPEFELSDTDRLGLFVVSRLARRQGVRVSLQPSPYGGTTAVVFIPGAILTEPADGGGHTDREHAAVGLDKRQGASDAAPAGGRMAALAQVPVPLPERETLPPAVIDGPVELEAPLGPQERSGRDVRYGAGGREEDTFFRGRRARERGGDRTDRVRELDRERERDRSKGRRSGSASVSPLTPLPDVPDVPDVPDAPNRPDTSHAPAREQHQQTRDQAPGGTPRPLPRRRRPAVLVSDHGRPVNAPEGQGAPGTRGTGEPSGAPEASRRTDDAGIASAADAAEDQNVPQARALRSTRTDRADATSRNDEKTQNDQSNQNQNSRNQSNQNQNSRNNPQGPHGPRPDTAPRDRPATTAGGLPRRVRQASLAPQLKATPAERAAAAQAQHSGPAADRDAEAVRDRMAALQRGWQRGRQENDERADTYDGERAGTYDGERADTYGDPYGPAHDRTAGPDGGGSTAPGTTSGGDGR
ncbi:nitrate- and nitrite sensing domain-containing protein [Streptomyces sp. MST-110588]|uniref:nitrate- and nitrite sensing domain-containing protein n=1 Tax=Streptomyces sp. MST-110588 TaxID=2833628 RepID=UPI001F5D5B35|nr:nitrate- and nitrite sensing domain-containing protein [Streptomyces sp. MST-110588]UNO38771.1 sensor histidine kinase [Streptomyces sp. MST-110588]